VKYINKICYINEPYLRNLENKSPYWFIFNIESNGRDYTITALDLRGNIIKTNRTKHWVYTKIELVSGDFGREFIRHLFYRYGMEK